MRLLPCDSESALPSIHHVQTLLLFAFGVAALIRIVNNEDLTDEQKDDILGFHTNIGLFACLVIIVIVFLLCLVSTYCYKLNEVPSKFIEQQEESHCRCSISIIVRSRSVRLLQVSGSGELEPHTRPCVPMRRRSSCVSSPSAV